MSEEEIIIQLKRKEEKALGQLFDLYYERLYLFAEKYIYDIDKAHDIVQDVFLRVWEIAPQLEIKTSIRYYLLTAVRNGCLNYLKSLKIEDRNNRKYAEIHLESQTFDLIEDEEVLQKIRSVLDRLPEKCREVCLLRFVEGYKYREISEKLNMNENTVKAQLHRGMEKFREAFEGCDYPLLLCILSRWLINRRHL